ncbi:hypothetical protein T11_18404 [Trichinella zimbabwensis]|uniref:Uncharacterized protein n=1 Tax=Trichinella zimbabwensis TaxID=268475 RepID=A0A0V1GWN3_9BILA|nr:hypothetical protein T11_18404 [Trichinella zimbabwensis]
MAGFWAHGRGFSRRLIACCALVAGKFKDFEMLSERSIAVPLLNLLLAYNSVHTCAGYLMIPQTGRVQSQNAFCQVQFADFVESSAILFDSFSLYSILVTRWKNDETVNHPQLLSYKAFSPF